jgi:hypothetical protein
MSATTWHLHAIFPKGEIIFKSDISIFKLPENLGPSPRMTENLEGRTRKLLLKGILVCTVMSACTTVAV